MKRHFLLIAFILSVLFSGIVSAANVTKVTITTKEPLVGEKQSFKASVPETASTEIYEDIGPASSRTADSFKETTTQ